MGLPAHMIAAPGDTELVVSLKERLAATYLRITGRVQAEVELAHEKTLALEWCRNNGNPHLPKKADD